ncbi:hypothetical protein [Salipiger sp.]|uniref:hypothetical protein n=1 Tax=Salipiger sp. TaxID=2078585 RepID=UPI003A9839FB
MSENPDFVDACVAAGIAFIGPGRDHARSATRPAPARSPSRRACRSFRDRGSGQRLEGHRREAERSAIR